MPKKVVLLGDFGVGKTSFGLRLSEDRFEETTIATLGVAHFTCKVAGLTPFSAATKLEVWDTAGQERYRSLDSLRLYLRRALGAIVVVDVTSAGSLEAAKRVVSQLRLDEDCAARKDLAIAVAYNKCDFEARAFDPAAVAWTGVCVAVETSCKTGAGVQQLARALVDALPADDAAAATSTVGLTQPGASPTSGSDCC
jgi:Ras-related protein Rab-5C